MIRPEITRNPLVSSLALAAALALGNAAHAEGTHTKHVHAAIQGGEAQMEIGRASCRERV